MNRRSFISNSSLAFIPFLLNGFPVSIFDSSHPVNALAAEFSDNDNILLLVQLFGGNDGLNTIIPVHCYDRYFNARKNIAISEKKLLKLTGHDEIGIHPSFASARELFEEGKLAIIHSAGYAKQDFSHFKSTDIWLSGQETAENTGRTGWLARYLALQTAAGKFNATASDPPAVQIGGASSLVFRGTESSFAANVTSPGNESHLAEITNDLSAGKFAAEQLSFLKAVAEQTNKYSKTIRRAAEKIAEHTDYPEDNPLAQQLKIVAKLIRGGLQTKIYMVSFEGFDTHSQQTTESDTSKGRHADLLKITADAIKAFQQDMDKAGLGKKVTGVTVSEFGRRIVSNNSMGTDHGAAAPLFVFGNAVKGGVYGKSPDVPATATADDNVPMQTDFRSVYATVLKQHLGASEEDVKAVLMQSYPYLDFMR